MHIHFGTFGSKNNRSDIAFSVVLAGVDQYVLHGAMRALVTIWIKQLRRAFIDVPDCRQDWCGLDEIAAGNNDGEDPRCPSCFLIVHSPLGPPTLMSDPLAIRSALEARLGRVC
jgi:hypothetical protein